MCYTREQSVMTLLFKHHFTNFEGCSKRNSRCTLCDFDEEDLHLHLQHFYLLLSFQIRQFYFFLFVSLKINFFYSTCLTIARYVSHCFLMHCLLLYFSSFHVDNFCEIGTFRSSVPNRFSASDVYTYS